MARIRTIKPEFWTDAKTGRLTDTTKCLMLGMLNHADDHGVISVDLDEWRIKIFPYHSMSDTGVLTECYRSLLDAKVLVEFEHAGTRYAWIKNFEAHQVINRPSKARLTGWVKGDTPDSFMSRQGALTEYSPRKEGKGKEGSGREESKNQNPTSHTSVFAAREVTDKNVVEKPHYNDDPAWKDLRVKLVQAFERANNINAGRINPDNHIGVWWELGYEPSMILAVVQAGLSKNPKVHGLGYFENQLMEAHTKRDTVRAAAPAAPTVDWNDRLDFYEKSGFWSHNYKGRPNMASCPVPIDILIARGYRTPDGQMPPPRTRLDVCGRIVAPPDSVAKPPDRQRAATHNIENSAA